jgi:hypothetical protein
MQNGLPNFESVETPRWEEHPMGRKVERKPRLMLALMCIWVAGVSVVFLFVENTLGWFLFFSPGWANGWPGGIRYQTVLSIGTTAYILLELMTAATAVGAAIAFILTLLGVPWERAGRGSRTCVWFLAAFVSLALCLFWYFYVMIGPEPPNLDG